MGVVLMRRKLLDWTAASMMVGGVVMMVGSDVLAATRRFPTMSNRLEVWGCVWVVAGSTFLAQQVDV